jgi:hypothetical protein
MIKNLIANWKTTSAGLLMISGSVIHLIFSIRAHTANENTWTIAVTAIIGGLGLLVAGDASQSAPVQPPGRLGEASPPKEPSPDESPLSEHH